MEKNEEKMNKFQEKSKELRKMQEREKRNLLNKHKQQSDQVVQAQSFRQEEVNLRKEFNQLRKMDQQESLTEIRNQHQQKMLKLQAKHFQMDAKNTAKKMSMDHQREVNLRYEIDKKQEMSVQPEGFKIKSLKHLDDISEVMGKHYNS